jgi:hypothetical protein
MLYALLCYDCEDVVMSREEDAAVMERISRVTGRLAAAGRMGPAARLLPTTAATTLRKGRDAAVIDGPYAETKEQLLGFFLVHCDDLEGAIAAARDLAAAGGGAGAFEIRPVAFADGGRVRA